MEEIGAAMALVLDRCGDAAAEAEVRNAVCSLCRRFPFYAHLLRPR